MTKRRENEGYSAKYDAFFNTETFEWYESPCGNPECEFCSKRPEKAYGVNDDIDVLRLVH